MSENLRGLFFLTHTVDILRAPMSVVAFVGYLSVSKRTESHPTRTYRILTKRLHPLNNTPV